MGPAHISRLWAAQYASDSLVTRLPLTCSLTSTPRHKMRGSAFAKQPHAWHPWHLNPPPLPDGMGRASLRGSLVRRSDAWVCELRFNCWQETSSLRALAHLSALLLQSARALLLPLPAKLRASLSITTGWDLLPLAATKHFLLLTGCAAFLYGLDLCAMAPSPPEALRFWLLSTKLYSTANQ